MGQGREEILALSFNTKSMNDIIKIERRTDPHELYILRMWLMFLRAPGRKTRPGEPVELGEIGSVEEKNWTRETAYSPVRRVID